MGAVQTNGSPRLAQLLSSAIIRFMPQDHSFRGDCTPAEAKPKCLPIAIASRSYSSRGLWCEVACGTQEFHFAPMRARL